MEEVKLWVLDGSMVAQLKPSGRMESELLLEETLVANSGLLMEDLTLVGRQTPTEGGPLDLLGVDGDGRLVVFELKRGTLARDAVAQVIDYASFLDGMDLDALADYISRRSGVHGIEKIEDFLSWYADNLGFEDLESLKPLRIFLVGLGVDDRTERMVRFLAENSGMDISLLTFHGFDYDGKMMLAKQVEVEGTEDSDTPATSRRLSREERRYRLNSRVEERGVKELFDSVIGMFAESWPELFYVPSAGARSMSIRLSARPGSARGRRAYVRVDPETGRVRIVFYPRAVELSTDAFKQPIERIPYETWPRNRTALEDANTEIQFLLTPEGWGIHKEKLTTLVQSLYEAWQD